MVMRREETTKIDLGHKIRVSKESREESEMAGGGEISTFPRGLEEPGNRCAPSGMNTNHLVFSLLVAPNMWSEAVTQIEPHLVQAGALPSHLPPANMRCSLPSFCVKPTGVLWKLSSKNLFLAVSGLGCCSGCCNKSWALRLSPAANELRAWANQGTAPILLAYLRGLGATLEPLWALLSIIPGTEHSPWPLGTWRLAPLGRIPNFFVKMVFCMTCEIRMGGLNQ